MDITSKALLSTLSISMWGGAVIDKRVSSEVAVKENAAVDAGNYTKRLVGKSYLGALQAIASAARQAHYAMTLPWSDQGARMLPAAMFDDYATKMSALRDRFAAALEDFLRQYPAVRAAAQIRLGDMFKDDDFPDDNKLRNMFSFGVRYEPIPVADFRVKLSTDQVKALEQDFQKASDERVAEAMSSLWQRTYDAVQHLADKLDNYGVKGDGDKRGAFFKNSTIENLREIAALLPAMNLTADARLDGLAREILDKLGAYDADSLREDETLRRSTADDAKAIMAKMSAYYGAPMS